jgi:hypothetical protein
MVQSLSSPQTESSRQGSRAHLAQASSKVHIYVYYIVCKCLSNVSPAWLPVCTHPPLPCPSQQVKDMQAQSSSWALSAGNYLTQLEDYQRHVTKLIGPRTKVRDVRLCIVFNVNDICLAMI